LEDEIQGKRKYKKLNIETSIQTGRSVYAILEEIKNRNIDLVVMGATGRTGLEKIIFGSTTAAILQKSKAPVLTVPNEASFNNFSHIIFATDYKDGDLKALQFLVKLAELFNSKLLVYHSLLKSNLKSEIMFRGFKELVTEKISYKNIVFEEDKSTHFLEAVINKVEQQRTSLLAMVHYEKSFPPLPKEQSKEMSYYSEIPLLVLPGQELTNTKE
jgi:nucleotide-binding universal stress UspA family protein